MESPATWTKAEWIVLHAVEQAESDIEHGRLGLSMTRQITDALRKAGLLPTDLPALGVFSPPEESLEPFQRWFEPFQREFDGEPDP